MFDSENERLFGKFPEEGLEAVSERGRYADYQALGKEFRPLDGFAGASGGVPAGIEMPAPIQDGLAPRGLNRQGAVIRVGVQFIKFSR